MASTQSTASRITLRMPFTTPSKTTGSRPAQRQSEDDKRRLRRQISNELSQGPRPRQATIIPANKVPVRSMVPELNIITSFDNPRTPPQPGHRPRQGHRRQESIQDRRKMARQDGTKGPVENLRRSDSKMSELSPSDRNLVIGISVPADSPAFPKSAFSSQGSLSDMSQSLTPVIIVTPVSPKRAFLLPPDNGQRRHRRPSSSLYSQATHFTHGVSHHPIDASVPVPPLPTMSTEVRHVDQKNLDRSVPRITSWGTEFSEGSDVEEHEQSRPPSRESQHVIFKRSSMDTLATQRSKGWWNHLLSPFLERSNSTMTRNNMPLISPALRALAVHTSPNGEKRHSVVSVTDICNEKRDTTAFFKDVSPGGESTGSHRDLNVLSPDFVECGGFGAGAEYYEACWHDQESNLPFFACQNHDCSLRSEAAPRLGDAPDATRHRNQNNALHNNAATIPEKVPGVVTDPALDPMASPLQASSKELKMRSRTMSQGIDMEDDVYLVAEVQQARAVPIVRTISPFPATQASTKASHAQMNEQRPDQTQAGSPPHQDMSALTANAVDVAASPVALTPSLQRAIPMGGLPSNPRPTSEWPLAIPHKNPEPVTIYFPPPPNAHAVSSSVERKEDQIPARIPRSSRLVMCLSRSKAEKRAESNTKERRKRRCVFLSIMTALLAIIVLILVLVLTLTSKRADIPVQSSSLNQSSWLNLTDYPPLPTGIATIARPNPAIQDTSCVQPATMWSCAVPKEQQQDIAPNDSNQPNFRLEIRYQNGTSLPNTTHVSSRSLHRSGNAVSAADLIRHRLLQIRDSFTDSLYASNPAPPAQEDQAFLGQTTDGNSAPFDGEATPFFMSFLSAAPVVPTLRRRDDSPDDLFPNITASIPPPSVNSDGTATDARLLPLPSAQPLRLYNRGQATEHYGFYTYFDRSIFLKSVALPNGTYSVIIGDVKGGAGKDAATTQCTWAQTRFLVQIWTRKEGTATLLGKLPSKTTGPSQETPTGSASNSSANDLSRPGSFPYPVSITLDRHGGDVNRKKIYCYGMDTNGHIVESDKKINVEDRGFGGTLVNPFGNQNVSIADGGPGGIDGGSGGCACQWRNWEKL